MNTIRAELLELVGQLLTSAQAARRLGLKHETVTGAMFAGDLVSVLVGHTRLTTVAACDAYRQQHRGKAGKYKRKGTTTMVTGGGEGVGVDG